MKIKLETDPRIPRNEIRLVQGMEVVGIIDMRNGLNKDIYLEYVDLYLQAGYKKDWQRIFRQGRTTE